MDVGVIICVAASSLLKFWNINQIPYRSSCGLFVKPESLKPQHSTQLRCFLGPTNPCTITVNTETSSTSAFKVLI